MGTFVNIVNPLLNLWLLIVLHREGVRKQLPWFVLYVLWAVLSGTAVLAVWLVGRQLYDSLSWSLEVIEIALIVAAVRESFLRLFGGFRDQPGFRWSVWSVIAGAVIYAGWTAIAAPSVQHNKLGIFEVDAELLFRWIIFGIALLTTFLGLMLKESPETREDAVIMGFGFASAGFLVYIISFSLFGAKYTFFTKFAPPVGYFLGAGWWLWVFSHPVADFGFNELGMGPADIAKALRRSRELVQHIMRKER